MESSRCQCKFEAMVGTRNKTLSPSERAPEAEVEDSVNDQEQETEVDRQESLDSSQDVKTRLELESNGEAEGPSSEQAVAISVSEEASVPEEVEQSDNVEHTIGNSPQTEGIVMGSVEDVDVVADDTQPEEREHNVVDDDADYEEVETEEGEEGQEHQVVLVEEVDEDHIVSGDETSEIILCVDTSVAGESDEFEVIQPNVFIQKQNEAKSVSRLHSKSVKSLKQGIQSSSPQKMVKITYGGGLSEQAAEISEDDAGQLSEDSEHLPEAPTKVIQFTTTTSSGQQITATTLPIRKQPPVKIIKSQAAHIKAEIPLPATLKRNVEDEDMDSYTDTEYEMDASGVLVVKRQSSTKKRLDPKTVSNSSLPPKSIACYFCNFRSQTVEGMEHHLSEDHAQEAEDAHRKRMRKRPRREGDYSSDYEDSSDLSILDETRESKNPNFQCWRCNNRPFAGSGSLRRHINAVHLRLGNHPCQYCGKLFSAKHNLKVHIQTVHLRQRNYVCAFCNRSYTENRSLKRHIEASHAGQSREELEFAFEQTRKESRFAHTKNVEIKYIDSSNIVYEADQSMNSFEVDDSHQMETVDSVDETTHIIDTSEEAGGESKSDESPECPVYIVPNDEQNKTEVVIFQDDSISASEEVIVGSGEMAIAQEEVVITNNVDVALEDNGELETIEIKVEMNSGDQESFYSIEPVDSKDEQQLVMYEMGKSGDELLLSGREVVVSNEDVGEHEQVTIHYISDGAMTTDELNRSTYQVTYNDDGNEMLLSNGTAKRKSYQRIRCGYCGDFFCSRQLFYKHANKVHREQLMEDWFSCPECRRYFPSVEAVKLHCSLIHANENKKTECPYCSTMFTRTCTYYRHANQAHLDIISKTWLLCDGCDLYMPDSEKLRQHQVHAHPPRKQK